MALRQNYSFLRFFNKQGEDLNFTYDAEADKWIGAIYLDKVSTGLIEYEPVYVLEEVIDEGVPNIPLYRRPKRPNLLPLCPTATTDTDWEAKWLDRTPGTTADNVTEIFLWQIEGYPGPDPTIEKYEELEIPLEDFTNDLLGPNGGGATGQSVITSSSTNWLDEALSIRVGLQSDEEGSYQRTLQLVDPNYIKETSYDVFDCNVVSDHVFCEIRYYGECEGEDERLETLIENMGSAIKNTDGKIFDDVDINEALPDWIKLNTKRKELLLEFSNIFPYTGAYKALINILKYFGYDQVTLKEYWLNVAEAEGLNPEGVKRIRYKQTPIEDLFSTEPKTVGGANNLFPNKLFKKTSKFGLFYDITRDSGAFDPVTNLPIVEEAFLFSNEEVLIKLFALKQKLKHYFLPLNARIVDIIGEAVFYSLYDVNIWSDLLRVDDVEVNANPCIKYLPEDECSYIMDLQAKNFLGIKVPTDLQLGGVQDFKSFVVGVTYNSIAPGDASGNGDVFTFTDAISGATWSYTTDQLGLTSSEVVDNIVTAFNNELSEPWVNFSATKETGQDPLGVANYFGAPNNLGYEILYIVQEDIIGPTGANFDMTTAVTGGPTSFNAGYVPGVTSTPYGLGASAIGLYSSAFLGYFNGFNRDASELPDYPCAPIGAPFLLTNCTFDFPWEEAEVNWNQLDVTATPGITGNDSVSNFSYFNYTYTEDSYPIVTPYPAPGPTFNSVVFTYPTGTGPNQFANGPTYSFGTITSPTANAPQYDWYNVGYHNFYEMEWFITHDTSSFSIESGLMSIDDGMNYPIILPFEGTYTVKMKLYDTFGGVSEITDNAKLCVKPKDIDFIGHYRFRECDYEWDDTTIKRQSETYPGPSRPIEPIWGTYGSIWDLPTQLNEQISMFDTTWDELDRIEFYQTQNDPQFQGQCDDVSRPPFDPAIPGSTGLYDLDSYRWNLIENNATWRELCHLYWDILNPKMCQIRLTHQTNVVFPIGSGTTAQLGTTNFSDVTMLMVKEPTPLNINKRFYPVLNTNALLLLNSSTVEYGDLVKNMSNEKVYRWIGPGFTIGDGWQEVNYEVDVLNLSNIASQGSLNDCWKELARQINTELETNGNNHPVFNDLICYYSERYATSNNALDPYLQFVTKEHSTNHKYHLRIFQGATPFAYNQATIFGEDDNFGSGKYLSSYETTHFGDMGDTPNYFEIFAVGASGGTITLPGATYQGQIGPTNQWSYEFDAGNIADLWEQMNYASQSLSPTGASANIEGPILDYNFNIVYGASGYSGTPFPPTTGYVPVKIQGSKKYHSSNDYGCVKFSGPSSGTDIVLGGTSGFAGTMCGRSIVSNPTFNSTRIHKYAKDFPLLTNIQFTYSNSLMHGKALPQWELIKENDPNWVNIYYNNPYFSYTFTQKGSYTLKLTLTDNQGNTKTKTKKEFVKII